MKQKKLFGLITLIGCSIAFLAGCNNNSKNQKDDVEDVITHVLEESEPLTEVNIGPFESIKEGNTNPVSENVKTYSSSAILDMPRDQVINIVYDNKENRTLQSVASLLTNIVDANNDVHIVSITDRGGNVKNNLLSTDGSKLSVSSPYGFQYGEVYQIEINDAPYLSFEGRDPQIRKLTIEIEDDPMEADTYDIKDLKNNIVKIDRSKVINKKENKTDKTYSFDYNDDFPNLQKNDIFYATINGQEDDRLDFYGAFINKSSSNNVQHITYRAPDLDEIYDSFHMKGIEPANLDEADILLNSEFATQQFKQSSLARGLVKTILDVTPVDIATIIDIVRHINFVININVVGDRVETKTVIKLSNYKIKDYHYIGFEIGHENITDYTFDFDLKISYSFIFPTGVDYKIKCIEDTQDIWYFRFAYDHEPIPEVKESDADYTDKLLDDIMDSLDGKSSKTGELIDKDTSSSVSGTKITFPLLSFNINYFTPLQIRFKIDFYFDFSLQVIGLVKYESHSRKVDFNFTNMSGGGQDSQEELTETSNLTVYVGGGLRAEAGLRVSLGVSIFGLYDYLHIEGYAEVYINLSFTGMIAMNIDFTANEFSGYYSIDLALTCGIRAGIDVKVVFTSFGLSYNWSWYLFRAKFDCPMEHWSEIASETIEMDRETLSIDETNALWIKYFDPLTWTIKEKKYKGNDKYSILSGILVPQSLIDFSSGNIFSFTAIETDKIEVNENGLIHVKDGTENTFTAHIKIHVSVAAGFVSDRTIAINYTSSDVKDIYAGNELIDQRRPSATIILPEAPFIRGKEFQYYTYEGQQYEVGASFVVPNHSVQFELHYRDLPTYRVYFYDGYNILVAFDEVYEGEDATAPDPIIRDRYMDEGWEFFYWDRSFKNVRQEIHVVACYTKVG